MNKVTVTATGRESDKFMLRLPDGMRDQIAEAASANGRSMNAQIVFMLARYFELEMRDSIRQYEVARDEQVAAADPKDLMVGDRILKEFNEQQTSMLMGLLVKHGVISAAPKAEKPKREKPVITKKKVVDS